MSSLVSQNNLRLFYYRYKDTTYFSMAVIAVVFAISILLFFKVIIPQLQNWFSIRNEVARTNERIKNIEQNISFMNQIDKSVLSSQLALAASAVPLEKSFGAIVNALSEAAVFSGIELNDFSFQVGDVASSAGKLNIYGQKGLSALSITVSTKGDVNGINAFIKKIQEVLPLSEVTAVDGDGLSTSIAMQFYQRQLPNIVFKDDQLITPLSEKDLTLLKKLESWQPAAASQDLPVGTESAEGVPLF